MKEKVQYDLLIKIACFVKKEIMFAILKVAGLSYLVHIKIACFVKKYI